PGVFVAAWRRSARARWLRRKHVPHATNFAAVCAGSIVVGSKLKCPVFVAHEMSGLRSMDRRRRGCGKVGIPRPLRDFQAQWKPCLVVSTERLFHSLSPAIPLRLARPRPSLLVVSAYDMRP